MDYKVDKETALIEFERFLEEMDIDADPEYMDDEDKSSFEKMKGRLIKQIQKGSLIINDNGEAVYTPQNEKSNYDQPITFHERSGASVMATDGKKKNQNAAKTYAMMGEIARVHPKTFANMVGIDIKVCEAIFALLMD